MMAINSGVIMKTLIVLAALTLASAAGTASAQTAAPVSASVAAAPADAVDAATRKTVVEATAQLLTDNYIFPDKGRAAAALLRGNLEAGGYDTVRDRKTLALRLTDDMRGVTHDLHVRVMVDETPEDGAAGDGEQGPFLFNSVDRLKGNIGYVDLRGFLPRDIFAIGANAAMRSVADTDAVILDLRHNHGGDPAAVAYLVSFFLDAKTPVHVNDVVWRKAKTDDYDRQTFFSSTTPVTFIAKPVYVLVSGDSFSGGEEFPYDMQSLKLATLVGQTTGGGANPGRSMPVGAGMSFFVPYGRAENPVTKSNWEGTGVKPEIVTAADDAFATAYAAALSATGRTAPATRAATAADVRDVQLLQVRTQAQPGGDAAVRRQVEALVTGKQPMDLFSPSMAEAMSGPVPPDIQAMIVALGPLQSVTFDSVNWIGEDVYDVKFAKGDLTWNNLLNEEGKVVSTYFNPKDDGAVKTGG